MAHKEHIYGIHATQALLSYHPENVITLYLHHERHDGRIEVLKRLAKENHIPINYVDKNTLDKLVNKNVHQGAVAFCHRLKPRFNEKNLKQLIQSLNQPPFILILDSISDPHNLGACMRSAEASGVHFIIAPKDHSATLTPSVNKAASGAANVIPFIAVTNLVRTMQDLKELGIWIYGADANAHATIYETDLIGPVAFVLGAEGAGLRRLTRDHCDALMRIPMMGQISSLNISVAAGICLFERVRQSSYQENQKNKK